MKKIKARVILAIDYMLWTLCLRICVHLFKMKGMKVYSFWRRHTKFLNSYKFELNRFKEMY